MIGPASLAASSVLLLGVVLLRQRGEADFRLIGITAGVCGNVIVAAAAWFHGEVGASRVDGDAWILLPGYLLAMLGFWPWLSVLPAMRAFPDRGRALALAMVAAAPSLVTAAALPFPVAFRGLLDPSVVTVTLAVQLAGLLLVHLVHPARVLGVPVARVDLDRGYFAVPVIVIASVVPLAVAGLTLVAAMLIASAVLQAGYAARVAGVLLVATGPLEGRLDG